MADHELHIKALYTYPIKSLRGCALPSITATTAGFDYDRRFMLIRAEDGQNMHVSGFTEMCLFTTELARSDGKGGRPDVIHVRYGKDHTFKKPDEKVDQQMLSVPLTPDPVALQLEQVEVSMHRSSTHGYDMGEKYNLWFSRRFGYNVRLLYVAGNRRKVLGNVTPNFVNGAVQDQDKGATSQGWLSSFSNLAGNIIGHVAPGGGSADDKENISSSKMEYKGVDDGIGFADCAPFLVINSKSWENANRRLPEDVELDITKFRPNIIIDGPADEFEEDFWAELRLGNQDDGVRIALTQNCARCNSLNVDYSTGVVGTGEAGKILKKLQKDRRVDLGTKYSPIFGRYGFLAQKNGSNFGEIEIKVGESVAVVKRNTERTRFQWPGLGTDK